MSEFKNYKKKVTQPLRPYEPGEDLTGVSISEADRAAGSPKVGDMIAYKASDPTDRWLVSAATFEETYDPTPV